MSTSLRPHVGALVGALVMSSEQHIQHQASREKLDTVPMILHKRLRETKKRCSQKIEAKKQVQEARKSAIDAAKEARKKAKEEQEAREAAERRQAYLGTQAARRKTKEEEMKARAEAAKLKEEGI